MNEKLFGSKSSCQGLWDYCLFLNFNEESLFCHDGAILDVGAGASDFVLEAT